MEAETFARIQERIIHSFAIDGHKPLSHCIGNPGRLVRST